MNRAEISILRSIRQILHDIRHDLEVHRGRAVFRFLVHPSALRRDQLQPLPSYRPAGRTHTYLVHHAPNADNPQDGVLTEHRPANRVSDPVGLGERLVFATLHPVVQVDLQLAQVVRSLRDLVVPRLSAK